MPLRSVVAKDIYKFELYSVLGLHRIEPVEILVKLVFYEGVRRKDKYGYDRSNPVFS
jgi:hypothetical protein